MFLKKGYAIFLFSIILYAGICQLYVSIIVYAGIRLMSLLCHSVCRTGHIHIFVIVYAGIHHMPVLCNCACRNIPHISPLIPHISVCYYVCRNMLLIYNIYYVSRIMPYFLLCFLSIKEYAAQFFSLTTYAGVCSISLLCYCVYVNMPDISPLLQYYACRNMPHNSSLLLCMYAGVCYIALLC
jgi:hypothetical protein